MSESSSPDQSGLLAEAAAWFARMRGPDAEASRPEFEAWLARGALHRAAYNRASEIFAMGKFLAEDGQSQPRMNGRRTGRSRPVLFAAAAALLLLVVSTGWLAMRTISSARHAGAPNGSPSAQLQELRAGSEARSVRLPDGSLVRLAAGSILDVSFTANERRSLLQHGLALFQVAHEKRPFVVSAGGAFVTAHGTIFEVRLSADRRVSVRLIEGVIDVKLPVDTRRPHSLVRRLNGSGAISFMAADTADAQATAPPASVQLTLTSGEPRDFDGIRLADLLALANRNFSRPIRLADPAIGQEPISGRFRTDDPDLLAERIALLLGLAIDRSDPRFVVLRRK